MRCLALTNEDEQRRIGHDIISRALSVRETEVVVKKIVEGDARTKEPSAAMPVDVHTRAAEDRLKLLFGTRVRIVRRGKKGRIEIEFNNEDELIRIFEQITER